MRHLLFMLMLALALPTRSADWERVQTHDNQILFLQGIGLNRQLNEDFYLASLYLAQTSPDSSALYDNTQSRRLHFRVLVDRIYAAGINRHFRDLMLINNPRDELVREATTIQRFTGLFKLGLLRGDEVLIDFRANKATTIWVNAVKVAEFSPRLFDLILRGLIGDKPPGQLFKTQLMGNQNPDRGALIAKFDTTVASEERLKLYATVEPAPTPALATTNVPTTATPATTITAAPKPEKPLTEKITVKTESERTPSVTAATTKPAEPITKPVATEKPLAVATREPPAPKTPPPPSNEQIDNWLAEYQAMLNDKFHSALSYPKREMKRKYGISQMARVKATIILRLFLDKGGDVNAAWLQKRSNETIIDQAALALVDVIAPFPPMRDELPESAYEFFVELAYDPDA